ncbi:MULTISPECIES: zinc-binding dehydrogenase [Kandleria]|jgi:ribitol-5-phosphate 2-dehydrogenase|uniref:Ribulose-5-phosphate reductase n=2 Tax=Kandleria vitulina TaxID=1630 RepID=A0A0R2HCW5_9FIRM|nr:MULTISPECIES: zinc-binding dehydrogenase [Kandleria]KRN50142.1 ribitol-5-phosphate 2-dehydrogenase [Kandleria vitulina DSM 20405]MBP3276745.1 zinc-binding dehydrogenase [Kandleria sp.]MEE0989453.1 zinc-binding dehydrogenase [Kandleria vitulina]SDL74468.1 ribitol-5-phosphate 2-dehydrogenase [Kandleria vitulina]SDW71713.1 ribitol-5-phosphate 2-dehydrogenase [Kandleria vitulina]
MINTVYRLIAPKSIRADFVDLKLDEERIIIRPTYLSICAADQRYYTGSRGRVVMKQKLPMALIHEAVGEVVYDPKGELPVGTHVVMIPNTPNEKDDIIKENYLRSSQFRASGFDGFMQNVVSMRRDLVIPFDYEPEVGVLLELMSVGMNAVSTFKKHAHDRKDAIGIWGNGNVGFVTALILRKEFPDAKIYVFGVEEHKNRYFSFADDTFIINDIPEDLQLDHAFECVGGRGSEAAISQIIDYIKPQGTINLMGVSENPVPINTRMVLEKGLQLLGNSRSNYDDFKKSVDMMANNKDVREYLSTIVSEMVVVNTIDDMIRAFEDDTYNDFKTVMKWEI